MHPSPPSPSLQAGRGKGLPEDAVWRYLIQSLLGLSHIHGKKIIHRDIKALNLFLDAGDNIKVRGGEGSKQLLGLMVQGWHFIRTESPPLPLCHCTQRLAPPPAAPLSRIGWTWAWRAP